MKIFEFDRYKGYLSKRISLLPGRGRGELSRIAKALDIHTTMVTHVLKGDAHFSMEQTVNLAHYLGFSELETDYLVALVQWERAGNKRTKDFWQSKISELRNKALNLNRRLGATNQLSEQDRAFYYSSWIYTAVRLLTAVDRFQSAEAIAEELRLPIGKIHGALDFLVSRGLCIEEKNKIKYGSVATYIESSSPLVVRHHANWRQKNQERLDQLREEDLAFTLPCVLSEVDAVKIREKIVQIIEEIKKVVDPSPSEQMYVLNIDWMRFTRG